MKHLSRAMALSLLLAGNAVMAQEVSEDEARSRALQFLSAQTDGPRRAKGLNVSTDLSLAYTSRSEAKTCFYVFNVGDGDGFVIAGGDQAARPILGYSDHGTFDLDKAPDNFKWWLSQYTEQIAHAEAPSEDVAAASAARRAKAASANWDDIGPLIKTKWEQQEPYNSEIPIYDSYGNRFVTGCVATAMAQIMKYWNYPEQGQGSHSYKRGENEFSANFGETTYDWANMRKKYDYGEYTQKQAKAVSTLMYHVGVSVDMNYATSGSGASQYNVAPALVNYFKYDKSVRYANRHDYSNGADWHKLIYQELAAGRPIFYCAYSPSAEVAHAFICDGYAYKDIYDYFSINWGWGGDNDGFFALSGNDALYTTHFSNFNEAHEIIYNIQPAGMGTNEEVLDLTASGQCDLIYPEGTEIFLDNGECSYDHTSGSLKDFGLYFDYWNRSIFISSFDVGVKLTDTNTGRVIYFTCLKDNYSNWINLYFDPYEIEYNGRYEVLPVVRKTGQSDADWVDVYYDKREFTPPILNVTGAKDIEPVELDFTLESNTVQAGRYIHIQPNPYYKGEVTYTSSDTGIAEAFSNSIYGRSEGTVTISAHSEATEYFKETVKEFEITVTKKPDVIFAIEDSVIMLGGTTQLSWPKNYYKTPVFTSNSSFISVDENGVVTGSGQPGIYEITAFAPESPLYNQTDTTITVIVIDPEDPSIIEQPYFNNDDNVYKDDLIMHYKVVQNRGGVRPVKFYYSLEADGKTFKGTIETEEMALLDILSGTYDFRYIDDCDITDYLTEGEKYTIKLSVTQYGYLELLYYPSVTFTYRNKLTVDYGVSPAGYGTLILPFNAELPEGMTVYTCPEVDANGVLTLVEETSIRRNVPYIVKATHGENYRFEGPEAIDADKPLFKDGILVGAVTKDVPLQKGTDYILQVQDDKAAFYRYTGTKSDNADENDSSGNRLAAQFRAFLRLESAQNAKLFLPGMIDEETEGIATLRADGSTPAGIYTIDGHRHDELQKGLNILILGDGTAQKVFVK